MRQLSHIFKTLSTRKKIKFIIVFPVILIIAIVETLMQLIQRLVSPIGEWLYQMRRILGFIFVAWFICFMVVAATYIDETVFSYNGATGYGVSQYVYSNCHKMANNFIEAEDGRVRGYVRADEHNIEKILDVLDKYTVEDEEKLRKWLDEFSKGDYSNAVAFHNYCWDKLDGEVGKAVGLRKEYR